MGSQNRKIMKDPNTIDTHFVKLLGKGNIPEGLGIGRNYTLKASGTVTSKTEADNDDGSHTFYYKFKPIVIELVTDKGKSIKAKDTRSLSQLFRNRLWAKWNKNADGTDFDTYYDRIMQNLINNADEIVEMYGE